MFKEKLYDLSFGGNVRIEILTLNYRRRQAAVCFGGHKFCVLFLLTLVYA